jgi:hypothetical protein
LFSVWNKSNRHEWYDTANSGTVGSTLELGDTGQGAMSLMNF